jgi:hypothetical protein
MHAPLFVLPLADAGAVAAVTAIAVLIWFATRVP